MNYNIEYLSDNDERTKELIEYLKDNNIEFTDIKVTKFIDGRKVSFYKPDNLIINRKYILDTDNPEYDFGKPIKLLKIDDYDDDWISLTFENDIYIEIYKGYIYLKQFEINKKIDKKTEEFPEFETSEEFPELETFEESMDYLVDLLDLPDLPDLPCSSESSSEDEDNVKNYIYAPIGWYCWNEETQDVSCINNIILS